MLQFMMVRLWAVWGWEGRGHAVLKKVRKRVCAVECMQIWIRMGAESKTVLYIHLYNHDYTGMIYTHFCASVFFSLCVCVYASKAH